MSPRDHAQPAPTLTHDPICLHRAKDCDACRAVRGTLDALEDGACSCGGRPHAATCKARPADVLRRRLGVIRG